MFLNHKIRKTGEIKHNIKPSNHLAACTICQKKKKKMMTYGHADPVSEFCKGNQKFLSSTNHM